MTRKQKCSDCPAVNSLRRGLCPNCYTRRRRNGVELPPKLSDRAPCEHQPCHRRSADGKPLCRQHEERRIERAEKEAAAAAAGPRHDLQGYTVDGCRCPICREAHTTYRQELRAKHREEFARTGSWGGNHGTDYGYTDVGCRCDLCTAKHASKGKASTVQRAVKRQTEPVVEKPDFPRLVITDGGAEQITHWVTAGEGVWACASCDFTLDRSVPSTTQRRDAA